MAPTSDSKSKGQRRQDLFDLSLSLDPAERNDFLARRCAGDDDLRREVLALIRESEAKDGGAETGGRESADSGEPYRPGQRFGHYLIHDRIGHGGMGIVYRALDERLDRTVALKCLPPHLSRDDVSRQRFIVEAKSASRLDADELPSEQDRQSFIHFSSQRLSNPDHAQSSGPAPATALREARLQLSERAAARIAEGLSREVGPIARELMARRLHMDRTVKDLCESLAEFIDDRDSRARLIGSVRDLC